MERKPGLQARLQTSGIQPEFDSTTKHFKTFALCVFGRAGQFQAKAMKVDFIWGENGGIVSHSRTVKLLTAVSTQVHSDQN